MTATASVAAAEDRPAGPVAVLGDGLTVAAGSSKLLRGPSIYLGLLTLALAGPGVVSQLWIQSWANGVEPFSSGDLEAASQVVGLAGVLVVMALVGVIAVSIEGGAIGAMLIAGRVTGRPISLRVALDRSRRVYWRLVRAALLIGLVEIVASVAWRAVTNGPQTIGEVPNLAVEPIPGAIVSMPFIYSSVAIVVADDGARTALGRSVRLARQRLRLAIALAAFALLSGFLETLALGSGLDLIVRLTEALHLNVAADAVSLALAIALGLAVASAAGSLIFTVSALVSAPQIVAWDRLGLPTLGLPTPEPVVVPTVESSPPSGELDEDLGGPVAEPVPTAEPAPTAAPSAWAVAAATPPRFRWVTMPMRLTIAALWLLAIALLAGGPPA